MHNCDICRRQHETFVEVKRLVSSQRLSATRFRSLKSAYRATYRAHRNPSERVVDIYYSRSRRMPHERKTRHEGGFFVRGVSWFTRLSLYVQSMRPAYVN